MKINKPYKDRKSYFLQFTPIHKPSNRNSLKYSINSNVLGLLMRYYRSYFREVNYSKFFKSEVTNIGDINQIG